MARPRPAPRARAPSRPFVPEARTGRVPLPTAAALLAAGWAMTLTTALVPAVREALGFEVRAPGIALQALATAASLLESALWERRRWREALQWLGGTAWSCAFATFATCMRSGAASYAFALVYCQIAATYGRRYPFSPARLLGFAALPLLISLAAWPRAGVTALTLAGAISFALWSVRTAREQQFLRDNARLRSAYLAASQVATSGLDIALAMTGAEVGSHVHQLRNRLTPVLAYVALVDADPGLTAAGHAALADARRGLLASCKQLDDLMRSAQRRASRPSTLIDVAEVLREVAAGRESRGGGEVKVGPLPHAQLRGEAEQLALVLENLLDNACEAGARSIDLAAERSQGQLIITVRDDGAGIPEELRERVLDEPVQSSKARGHGLGLYLSRRLVDLLEGQLTIAQTGASGTTFRLAFPDESDELALSASAD